MSIESSSFSVIVRHFSSTIACLASLPIVKQAKAEYAKLN